MPNNKNSPISSDPSAQQNDENMEVSVKNSNAIPDKISDLGMKVLQDETLKPALLLPILRYDNKISESIYFLLKKFF